LPPVAQAAPARAGTDDAVLRGVAVGAGLVRGIARVIHHPADGRRLQKGDILVAPSTDPAWTPLFLKAAGLVMETGGYLSHGAIVAREFAIPAVVNLPGVLATVRDGDLLEVDGGSGRVRIIEADGAAAA
jgi:pyruvate,water dikinase